MTPREPQRTFVTAAHAIPDVELLDPPPTFLPPLTGRHHIFSRRMPGISTVGALASGSSCLAMLDCSPHLLVVGQQLTNATAWMRRLEAQGCLWEFVESSEAARRSIDRTAFDVVLADSRLPNGSAYDLIRVLQGTRSSLFFWVPENHSGRWLPIILRGHHQREAVAIRQDAFTRTLALLLHVSCGDERWPLSRAVGNHG